MHAHIYFRLLPKNVLLTKMVHFWRMEMEKGEILGRHPLDIPKNGKTREEPTDIHDWEKMNQNPRTFLLSPMNFAG